MTSPFTKFTLFAIDFVSISYLKTSVKNTAPIEKESGYDRLKLV